MYTKITNNRILCDTNVINQYISLDYFLICLYEKGIFPVTIDPAQMLRSCVGTSKYKRGSYIAMAPEYVDCASIVKWIYSQMGIWIPRRSIQIYDFGRVVDPQTEPLLPFDIVLTKSSFYNYTSETCSEGVGHVAIVTEQKTLIHALNTKKGIREDNFEEYLSGKWFVVRRVVENIPDRCLLSIPPYLEIETMDDFNWLCRKWFSLPIPLFTK